MPFVNPPPRVSARPRIPLPYIATGIVLLTVIVYLPTFGCGYIWDDDDYVTKNLTLRDRQGLRDIWLKPGSTPQYYPLVHTTYWLEYQLWGLNPAGFHLVNVLLHGLSAVMVWIVLQQLRVPGALLAALIFAVHPVHTESVAWITERKNTLSGLLYLCSAATFLKFYFEPKNTDRWNWYVASLILFAGALFSKTVTVTLPAALWVLVVWKDGRLHWRQVRLLLPMLSIGIPLALFTIWMEGNVVGTKFVDWDLSLVDRVLNAGRAICFYFWKLFLPVRLTFIYPRWEIDPGQPWQFAFPAAVLAAILAAWFGRGKIGAGVLVSLLLFVGTLSPALGFIDVYPMRFSFVADHFQYLASIAPISLFAALGAWGLRHGTAAVQQQVRWIAAPALVLLLGWLSWNACGKYRDLETLWSDTVAKNPHSQLALTSLGNIRLEQGNLSAALELQRLAVEADPDFGSIHNSLAAVYGRLGKLDLARKHAQRAVDLEPNNASARVNLGRSCLVLGQLPEAELHLREAVRLAPEFAQSQQLLGETLLAQGRPRDALQHLQWALALGPRTATLLELLRQAERALANDLTSRD